MKKTLMCVAALVICAAMCAVVMAIAPATENTSAQSVMTANAKNANLLNVTKTAAPYQDIGVAEVTNAKETATIAMNSMNDNATTAKSIEPAADTGTKNAMVVSMIDHKKTAENCAREFCAAAEKVVSPALNLT